MLHLIYNFADPAARGRGPGRGSRFSNAAAYPKDPRRIGSAPGVSAVCGLSPLPGRVYKRRVIGSDNKLPGILGHWPSLSSYVEDSSSPIHPTLPYTYYRNVDDAVLVLFGPHGHFGPAAAGRAARGGRAAPRALGPSWRGIRRGKALGEGPRRHRRPRDRPVAGHLGECRGLRQGGGWGVRIGPRCPRFGKDGNGVGNSDGAAPSGERIAHLLCREPPQSSSNIKLADFPHARPALTGLPLPDGAHVRDGEAGRRPARPGRRYSGSLW